MGNEAATRYLASVQEDVERMLGPGVEILALDWRQGPPVELALRYRLAMREAETVGQGDTVIAAHADLRQRLVMDRVKLGLALLTETRS